MEPFTTACQSINGLANKNGTSLVFPELRACCLNINLLIRVSIRESVSNIATQLIETSFVCNHMKQLNANSKNNNINRKLQNFILGLLQDPNEDAAKRSLNVMIELYKRRVWNDDKTVNAIWQGVMHSNPKICAAACKFFLILEYDMDDSMSEDSSDRDEAIKELKM